eukprot:Nitzschia sp. Nitz4//scaffold86_size83305//80807//83204//NITZ4_005277-RA/size83305-augustus-gene-0.70-mRNA-1//-1//CDS//3329559295//5900//frame0
MSSSFVYDVNVNDLENVVLHDLEDFRAPDFYENQPGDIISPTTTHRRGRKRSFCFGITLTVVACSFILAILFAMYGMEEKVNVAPTTGTSKTSAPQQDEETTRPISAVEATLLEYMDQDVFSDTNSIAYAALKWLESNDNVEDLSSLRLRQRLALATLYLGTNQDDTWVNLDGWMTDASECHWYGVECVDHSVIILNLTANGLEGTVPSELALLQHSLMSLELPNNDLSNADVELAWIGELSHLRLLDVANTYFSYSGIPTYISKLTDLTVLDVSYTMFEGSLDGSVFVPLVNLSYLELGGNFYNASFPTEISALSKLEALYVYEAGLEGSIDFIGSLDRVVELWVDDNKELQGTIPTEIGNLGALASFSLTNCNVRGQIPTEVGKLSHLQQMWLYGNWLSGSIPSEFGGLPKLQILGLENNNITDVSMPGEICELEMLALTADCGEHTQKIMTLRIQFFFFILVAASLQVSAFLPPHPFLSPSSAMNSNPPCASTDFSTLPGDPSLILTTNVDLAGDKLKVMKACSKVISSATGKPESYVAVSITDNASVIFGGSDAPTALGCLYSIGSITTGSNGEIQSKVTDLLEPYGVPEDRIYINFFDMPRENVGWSRRTFAG